MTRAILMDTGAVKTRGDTLGRVWWQGRQWSVTEHGIECRDGTYYIAADRLTETRGKEGIPTWPPHVCGKTWVDAPDFCTAFIVALALHGHGDFFTPADLERATKEAIWRYEENQEHEREEEKRIKQPGEPRIRLIHRRRADGHADEAGAVVPQERVDHKRARIGHIEGIIK